MVHECANCLVRKDIVGDLVLVEGVKHAHAVWPSLTARGMESC